MRLKVEINDLTPEQWEQAVRLLKTEYTIPDGASRVCLTILHEGEEWHLEIPMSAFTSLMWGMSLAPAFKALGHAVNEAMRHIRTPVQTVQCSPECEAQDDDRPHLMNCPTRTRTDT